MRIEYPVLSVKPETSGLLIQSSRQLGKCSCLFLALIDKYAAKMLALSDVVTPDSTTTVYEYIRAGLAQQKAQTYIQEAAQEVAADLRKPEYVEQKKTGAALDKLLNWGD